MWKIEYMKSVFCAISAFLLSFTASAYYPIIHNYSKYEYGGSGKIWQIIQTPHGIMHFANDAGILEFDGREWELTPALNRSGVRSLYYDEELNRLYFGATNEFGYLDYSNFQKTRYVSLVDQLRTEVYEIWGIDRFNDGFFLRENSSVFKVSDNSSQRFDFNNKVSVSKVVDGDYYIFVNGSGVFVNRPVGGGNFSALEGAGALKDKNICAILKHADNSIEFVSATEGLFHLKNGILSRVQNELSDNLVSSIAYCAASNEEYIAYGTVGNGVYILERSSGNLINLNKASGLQNNTVLSLLFDFHGNLWLGLENGISLVQLNSAEYTLLPSGSSIGSGYCSEYFNGKLYLGTNQGLYTLEGSVPQELGQMRGQIWYLTTIDNHLYCCADRGLGVFSETGEFSFIPLNGVWKIMTLEKHPEYLLGCSYDKLFLMKKRNGKWEFYKWIEGFDQASKNFEEAEDGRIWFSHWIKGLYKLELDFDEGRLKSYEYLSKGNDFPQDWGNTPVPFDGKIIFSTSEGFYSYNEALGKAEKIDSLNRMFASDPGGTSIFRCKNGDLFFSSSQLQAVRCVGAGLDSLSLNGMASKRIQGFEDIMELADGQLMVNTEDGFSIINRNKLRKGDYPLRLHIRQVCVAKSDRDSVILYSNRPCEYPVLTIPFKDNSLKFNVSVPSYGYQSTERFSFHLQGYNKGWSKPQQSGNKEYTKLPPGDYVLQVKAEIPGGNEVLGDEIEIKVLKPFYRQWWAIVLYVLSGSALLCAIGVLYKRRVERKAIAEQKERDNRHKEQIMQKEIKMKADELASSTMDLVRKNEILQHIDGELQRVVDNIVDDRNKSLKIIARIRSNIKENISHDNRWKKFEENFDLVYVDFLKRLSEDYPQLTATEKKLCAYLKMGLSSKEIAPLLNITIRSVEMNRYRVRQKLGLHREDNLTDFLDRF